MPLCQHTHTGFHVRNRQSQVASEVISSSRRQDAKTHSGPASFKQGTGDVAQGPVTACRHDGREATVQRITYEPALISRSDRLTEGKPRHVLSKQRQVCLLNTSAAPPP